MGTSINEVPRFLAIFDIPSYLVLLYNVQFLGLSWTLLSTLISDVINGRSLCKKIYTKHLSVYLGSLDQLSIFDIDEISTAFLNKNAPPELI